MYLFRIQVDKPTHQTYLFSLFTSFTITPTNGVVNSKKHRILKRR
uniref:Uncharacterized protein n=1 Tax=Nelumbo nucifera TaxID=4432 RepID=A0A822ZPZ0_NELNU|nr:TPA_asm: hypothetical protein HUJ06_016830 [Nelumbo nucifera]